MKLTKEIYIHNCLNFEENERDILCSAAKIVNKVRDNNIHSCGAEDTYLSEICGKIAYNISELLDNYSNEYPDKCE